MDETRKVVIAVIAVVLVVLTIGITYGLITNAKAPVNSGVYGNYAPYGGYSQGSTGYAAGNYPQSGSYGPYGNSAPYYGYGTYGNGAQGGGMMGGGMMGGGMMGGRAGGFGFP